MPTYTYQCKSCGASFDLFHAMSARPRPKCAECGGACKRLIGTGAGIIFKGSGFYETDYKKGSGKTVGSTPSSSAGSSEKAGASSESKASTHTSKD